MKTNVKINGQTVEIELTQDQIKQLQKATEPKSFKRWRAEKGENYWVALNYCGSVTSYLEDGGYVDNHLYAIGDYFKTRAEAEEHRKAVLKKQEILDFIREKNEGWVPVFGRSCNNYIIRKNSWGFAPEVWNSVKYAPTPYYFKSREIGEELIEKFGDDLNYLFV